MTPDDVEREAKAGRFLPVYLVLGEDVHTQSRLVELLKRAVMAGGVAGLNEDLLTAGEVDCEQVLSIARTLPMLARQRLVVVRQVERWEKKGGGSQGPLDRLADYAAKPPSSTVLVLVAGKLNKSRRLVKQAQKQGYLVSAEPLSPRQLPTWIERRAKDLEVKLERGVSSLLAELCGPELAPVADAVERLALYVGPGGEIAEQTVSECIVRVRPATVWQLVDAVGQRELGTALRLLDQVYDPHDRGLNIVGVLGWMSRQLAKMDAALAQGLSPPDAAKAAGAPPFRAGELAAQLKRISRADLALWLRTLREVDHALKGASKRPPKAILESAIIDLCSSRPKRARA